MTCVIDISTWEKAKATLGNDNISLLYTQLTSLIQDVNFQAANLKIEIKNKKDISDLLKQKITSEIEKIEKRLDAYINVIKDNKISINKYVVNPFIYNKPPSDWETVYPDIDKPKRNECVLLSDLENMKVLPIDDSIVPILKEKNIFEKYKWYFAGGFGLLVILYVYNRMKREIIW